MVWGMSSIINYNVCALILFLISLSLAFRDPMNSLFEENHKMETRSTRHYCGTNLVRALHFLCESYNKRSSPNRHISTTYEDVSEPENEMISDDGTETPNHSFALLKALHNRNDMKYFHRKVRGVVDECCRRSCTTSQLSQYCGVTRVTTTAAPLIE